MVKTHWPDKTRQDKTRQDKTRQDKTKHEDPQLASKKTLVSAWSTLLDPRRLKDVRGLAADGSSETHGLLKMKVSLCWAVVVL